MKKCSKCRKNYDESLYWKDRSRPDGLSARCIPCEKMKMILKDRDPEKHKARLERRRLNKLKGLKKVQIEKQETKQENMLPVGLR